LRDWRKAAAERDGVPVYAVLTNEQLAGIAAKRPESLAGLKEIEGLGDAKAGKYGAEVLAVVALPGNQQPDGTVAVPPQNEA